MRGCNNASELGAGEPIKLFRWQQLRVDATHFDDEMEACAYRGFDLTIDVCGGEAQVSMNTSSGPWVDGRYVSLTMDTPGSGSATTTFWLRVRPPQAEGEEVGELDTAGSQAPGQGAGNAPDPVFHLGVPLAPISTSEGRSPGYISVAASFHNLLGGGSATNFGQQLQNGTSFHFDSSILVKTTNYLRKGSSSGPIVAKGLRVNDTTYQITLYDEAGTPMLRQHTITKVTGQLHHHDSLTGKTRVYTGSQAGWTEKVLGESLTRNVSTYYDSSTRVVTESLSGTDTSSASFSDAFEVERRYDKVAGYEVVSQEKLNQNGINQVTTFTYHNAPDKAWHRAVYTRDDTLGGVMTGWSKTFYVSDPTNKGYWEWEYGPWKDGPTTKPGTVPSPPENFSGKVTGRFYQMNPVQGYKDRGPRLTKVREYVEGKMVQASNYEFTEGGTLRTRTKRFIGDPGASENGASLIDESDIFMPGGGTFAWQDGLPSERRGPNLSTVALVTRTTYEYSQSLLSINYATSPPTVTKGSGSTHQVTAEIDMPLEAKVSTKQVSYRDPGGNVTLEEIYILESGTTWATVPATKTIHQFDGKGRVIKSWKDSVLLRHAIFTTQTTGHPYVVEERAADGVVTFDYYDIDHEFREHKEVGGGGVSDIITTYQEQYEKVGGVLCRKNTATRNGLSAIRWTDQAGRPVKAQDEQGLVTTWAYSVGTGTGKGVKTTETIASTGTRVTTTYLDGQTYTVTGTGGVPNYYAYTATNFFGISTKVTTGLFNPVWSETHTDMAGRTTKIDRAEPGSATGVISEVNSYDPKLRLIQVEKKNGANRIATKRLIEYDDNIDGYELERRGMDYSTNGSLSVSGTSSEGQEDQIVERKHSYQKQGSDWWEIEEIGAYINLSSTLVLQSKTERKMLSTGSHATYGNVYAVVRTTDAAGLVTTTTEYVKAATKNRYVITDTSDSNIDARQDFYNGRLTFAYGTTNTVGANYSYDSQGRLQKVTDNSTYGESWIVYDLVGRTGQTYQKNGATTVGTVTYDYYANGVAGAGQVKSETNALGGKTYYLYDLHGRPTHQWGGAAYPVKYTYNDGGRISTMATYRGGSGWTGSSWPSSPGTADTTTWSYYANDGFLWKKQDAAGKEVVFNYHPNGKLASKTLARGITVNYTYFDDNKSFRLKSYTQGATTPAILEIIEHDRMGRPRELKDVSGDYVIVYHASGGISSETIGGSGKILNGVTVTTGYDGFGRMSTMGGAYNSKQFLSNIYSYSSQSRLSGVTSMGGEWASIGYHSGSDRPGAYTFYDDGSSTAMTTSRTYDGFGRLSAISQSAVGSVQSAHVYVYNALHQRTKATVEDGSWWEFNDYSDRGEIEEAYKMAWSSSIRFRGRTYKYAYDNLGNRANQWTGGDTSGAGLRQFGYTATNKNQYSSITNPNNFDVAGMSTYPTVKVNGVNADRQSDYFHKVVTHSTRPGMKSVTVQNYNSGGSPVGSPEVGEVYVGAATESPAYDFDGNLTADGRWVYTWDANDRLQAMESSAGSGIAIAERVKMTFAYDNLGRRVEKKVFKPASSSTPIKTEKYVWHGWHCMAKLNGNDSETYTWGLDLDGSAGGAGGVGGLLMIHELTVQASSYSADQAHFPMYDGNGNVMGLVGVWNNYPGYAEISTKYEYDPFGNVIRRAGSYAEENAWGFSTKFTDLESGYCYYGYRFYDPRNGRWLNRDPIGEEGGLNLYGFVGNDGVNRLDGWGLDEIVVDGDNNVYWINERLSVLDVEGGRWRMGTLNSSTGNVTLTPTLRRHISHAPIPLTMLERHQNTGLGWWNGGTWHSMLGALRNEISMGLSSSRWDCNDIMSLVSGMEGGVAQLAKNIDVGKIHTISGLMSGVTTIGKRGLFSGSLTKAGEKLPKGQRALAKHIENSDKLNALEGMSNHPPLASHGAVYRTGLAELERMNMVIDLLVEELERRYWGCECDKGPGGLGYDGSNRDKVEAFLEVRGELEFR